jgi:hypothetical protein
MANQILMRNRMKIAEGRLEPFSQAIREAVDFVALNGPQMMVQTFIDEEEMSAVSFQLYRNSQDVLRHWQLSDPYIQRVMEHCTVENFEVYGSPDSEVLAGLSQMIRDGRCRIVKPLAGFTRF